MAYKCTDSEYFFILSTENPDLAIDCEEGVTRLVLSKFDGKENQMFKFDEQGSIVSKPTGLVIDVDVAVQQGRNVVLAPKNDCAGQRWCFNSKGNIELLGSGFVMDIQGSFLVDGTHLITWPPTRSMMSQLFRIVNVVPIPNTQLTLLL